MPVLDLRACFVHTLLAILALVLAPQPIVDGLALFLNLGPKFFDCPIPL